ncbi:MAG: DUF4199 domain-containing protein [Bacteroidales bacterium]|nr:DUF4199 domain-containing protein [Bacteroidales bacterium]
MEEKSLFWKNSLKHGLIVGLVIIIYSVLLYVLELNLIQALGYVVYAILIAGFILGTKAFRDTNLNGNISYGKAFGYSIVILLIASIIYSIYSYLLITVIDPDMVDKIIALGEEKMLKQGMTDDQIEMAQSMQKRFMSPVFMGIMSFIGTMFIGTILALITSAVVKKEGDPYQEAMQDIEE